MTVKEKNPIVYIFQKTWRYSKGNRNNVVFYWIMFIVANTVFLFAQPLVWSRIINVITQQGITTDNFKVLLGLLLLTLAIDIFFWSLHGPARIMERKNAFLARLNYRKFLLGGVMALPMEWHVDHHSGDTIDKVEKGTNALYDSSESSFEIISSIVQLIGSYGMLIYFSPPSAYIVLAMSLLTVWITVRFDKVLAEQYKQLNHFENNVSESVFDSISNITTVIILRVEKLVFSAIVHKIEKPFKLFQKNSRISEVKWFLTNMCCTIMAILVLGVYFWQHIGALQGVLVGSVYLLINYLGKMSELFFRFTGMYSDLLKRKAKIHNSEELTGDFREESLADHVLPKSWEKIDINSVDFSYGNVDGSVLHLDDVSLSIRHGERIAFVGETGSGKTTLLKIMRDLYHPKNLGLYVDGKLVPQGFEGISQAISLVPQNPEIFATTILENITLGAEYEIDFVRNYTDMACFTEVAESLPHKFLSSIKEKGVNLSGGQQQRLALSRGLLACHGKDIVLLDEPTSSLDMATEMAVYQNVFRGFQGKTIISSIHRLHLLPLFNTIYMFDKGRVVGSGSLNELLATCQEFQTLWQKQYVEVT